MKFNSFVRLASLVVTWAMFLFSVRAELDPDVIYLAQIKPCPACDGGGKITCSHCEGVDLTKLDCGRCDGKGVVDGKECLTCAGTGRHLKCAFCQGKAAEGGVCPTCEGKGVVEFASSRFENFEALRKSTAETSPDPGGATPVLKTSTSLWTAQDGSYFGQTNGVGLVKVVFVPGYRLKDGRYIKSHFNPLPPRKVVATPSGAPSPRGRPEVYQPRSNPVYVPQTPVQNLEDVQVKGYYRKDGTYVQPHTRSRPK